LITALEPSNFKEYFGGKIGNLGFGEGGVEKGSVRGRISEKGK